MLHLPRQFLRLSGRLWIALDHLAKLVQLPHSLLERFFSVGVIAGGIIGLGPRCASTVLIVAGIDVAPHRAIRAPRIANANIACRSAHIAGSAQAVAAALTCSISGLLAPCLPAGAASRLRIALPALPSLQTLGTAAIAVSGLLPAALPILLILTRTRIASIRAVHRFNLIPEPLDAVERRRLVSFLSGSPARPALIPRQLSHGSLRLLQLLL
jgi:hypothetical protein